MTDSKLREALQPIVQEYGLGMVLISLGEIECSQCENVEHLATSRDGITNGIRQRKPKVTAPGYVKKMELPLEKAMGVTELAERFQQKAFLPTFGDVIDFCQVYAIEVPTSKSRVNAIPRVFKHIAQMEADEVQRILDYGMFSGPSRLGPISDAIRNFSRSSTPESSSVSA